MTTLQEFRIVTAGELSLSDAVVSPHYRLRFPASWRATPVGNRYSAALERETIAWLHAHGMGVSPQEREKLRKFGCGMYGGYSLPTAPFATALLV
ncbi:MAG TPA: hypothetical protein VGQ57_10230, partial [Polyangiaceae bacterium]|nr:hypothetical protein [Polyangiaceae bacterium]